MVVVLKPLGADLLNDSKYATMHIPYTVGQLMLHPRLTGAWASAEGVSV